MEQIFHTYVNHEFNPTEVSSVIGFVSWQQFTHFLQFLQVVFFQNQGVFFFLVSQNVKELQASESRADSVLECLVFFVYLSELFLAVVFNDVCHVNLGRFKKGFCDIWVCVVSDFDLFALDFDLFDKRKFLFFLFGLNGHWFFFFFLNAEFSISLSSHLIEQFFLVIFVSLLFNFVEFNLSLHGQFIGNFFGILHFFCELDSIFFPFSGLFLLSFFPYLSCLFGQLFEFSLCLFRC